MKCPRVEPVGLPFDVVLRLEDGEVVFDMMKTTDHLIRVEWVDGSYLALVSPCHLGLLHRRSVGYLMDLLDGPSIRCLVVLTVPLVVALKAAHLLHHSLDRSTIMLTGFTVVVIHQTKGQSLLSVFISNIHKKSLD